VTRALRSSQPASEELGEAVRWYETQRQDLGTEFFAAIDATIGMLTLRPAQRFAVALKYGECSSLGSRTRSYTNCVPPISSL